MNLRKVSRILSRNWLLLIAIPLATAASVYYFAPNKGETYMSDTTLYTGITTGYKIKEEQRHYGTAEVLFSNFLSLIESRDTQEEVSLRLLATHLMQYAEKSKALKPETYQHLEAVVPAYLRKQLVGANLEQTFENVTRYYGTGNRNAVYKLINSGDPVYSISALEELVSKRVGNSDLLKMEYTSSDPVVSSQTLEILTDVFIRKHKELFTSQNESVVNYFNDATRKSYERLQAAEEKLLNFNKEHKLVNFDEQMSNSASEKQNISELYNDLEVQHAGALSARKAVERTLKTRGLSTQQAQKLVEQQKQLGDVTKEIANLEVLDRGRSVPSNVQKLAQLQRQSDNISNSIRQTMENYQDNSHTIGGVPITALYNDYIRSTIQEEELRSKLASLRKQQSNFSSDYNKLVPLSAEIRKIRREVEVAEKEYLAQLDGLKESNMVKQNIELASQLKVVDPPVPPSSPVESPLPLLISFSFLGALLVTILGLIGVGMMDTTLKNPTDAARITNYPVFGVLPQTTGIGTKQLAQAKRAEDQLARQLLLKFHQKEEVKIPFVVGILSSQNGEGKSSVCTNIASKLNNLGINTLVALPEDHNLLLESTDNTTTYSSLQGVIPSVSIGDLTDTQISKYAIVLIEFPAVLESAYPVSLFKYLDLMLVAVKANRTWEQADRSVFKSIQDVTSAPIEVVLTDVEPDYVEEFVGKKFKGSYSSKNSALALEDKRNTNQLQEATV